MKNIFTVPAFSNIKKAVKFSLKNKAKVVVVQLEKDPSTGLLGVAAMINKKTEVSETPCLIFKKSVKEEAEKNNINDEVSIFLTKAQYKHLKQEIK